MNLFAGKDHKAWSTLSTHDWHGFEIINVDVTMGAQFDLHALQWGHGHICATSSDEDWWSLYWVDLRAVQCLACGIVHQALGVLRGRDTRRFMLDGLTPAERELALSDCALMFKQLGLWLLAHEHRGDRPDPAFLMESPRDPMDYIPKEATDEDLPSFWNFAEVKSAAEIMGASFAVMDQGPMGHKPPCLMVAGMPQMMELHGISGDGLGQPTATSLDARLAQSKEWSAWAPGLVAAIKECLKEYLARYCSHIDGEDEVQRKNQQTLKCLDMEGWKAHVMKHQPYRRDCRRCMELTGVDAPHRRTSGDKAAHCLSYDILGPACRGRRRDGDQVQVHHGSYGGHSEAAA